MFPCSIKKIIKFFSFFFQFVFWFLNAVSIFPQIFHGICGGSGYTTVVVVA